MGVSAKFKTPRVGDPEDYISFTNLHESGVFHAKIKVHGYPKEYRYTISKTRMQKDQAELSTSERHKDKKFRKLDAIFDFMDTSFRVKLSKGLENLVTLLFTQSTSGFEFSSHTVFKDLIAYLKEEGTDLRYSTLMKTIDQ